MVVAGIQGLAVDRRIARTRNALYDSLVALIHERSYASIKVEDIVAKANVGRSTFYAHFKSKDELLARSLERLRAELMSGISRLEDPTLEDVSSALFRHIDGHRAIHASLSGTVGLDIVLQAIAENLAQVMRTLIPASRRPGLPREVAVGQIAATFLMIVRWWLDRNPDLTWQQIDALFRKLLLEGLAQEWPELAARGGRESGEGDLHRHASHSPTL